MNKLIASSILMSGAGLFAGDKIEQKNYNVLFIIADDLTATAISTYDNKACPTPNVERLAEEGTVFTQAYCQFPVCGPSRASFMYSYYPHATRNFGYNSGRKNVGPDTPTWTQHFKNNGYNATRVSKIYHMGVPHDIYKGTDGADDPASWTQKFNCKGPEADCAGEAEVLSGNPDGTKKHSGMGGGTSFINVKAEGDDLFHADGKAAQKACELLKELKDEKFFLALGFVRPHVPFVAPKKYFEPFPHGSIALPEKIENDQADIPKLGINYKTSQNTKMSIEQQKKAVSGYYASVTYMDAQVGRVLDALEKEGLEDNTIVIFTSDHGYHLGEHDFWSKVGLMDESSKVPLIIKVPGQKPGRCNSFVELIDLYPTVASLCGLKIPKHVQGKNITKLLEDPTQKVRDAAFCVNHKKSFLLRTDKWAFIQHGEDASLGLQLYDMQKDPKQYTNLADQPEYKAIIDQFKIQLKDKLKNVRDTGIIHRLPPKPVKKSKKNKSPKH